MKPFDPSILLLTGSAFLLSVACKEQQQEKKPNILFILADDLGCRDLSCTGSKYYETPNIDRIAREGMVFTNGYAACQVSSPSRASIMTGKFPARHGITDWIGAPAGEAWRAQKRYNQLLPPEYAHALPAEYITLPEALKASVIKPSSQGNGIWEAGAPGPKIMVLILTSGDGMPAVPREVIFPRMKIQT